MITYPNQKIITIMKNISDNDFLQISNKDWQYACENLSYNAFKLYLWMAKNSNEYKFALSYEAVNEDILMCRKSYNNAIKDLRDWGYLYQEDPNSNQWIFCVNGRF